jgi:tetratricopeptide (TPR) repeat protein
VPLTEAQAVNALTVLARLAQREQDVGQWIYDAISASPETMILPAIRVATETGGPVGQILATVVHDADVPPEVLARALVEIPGYTTSLREAAVAIGEKLGDDTWAHAERLLEAGQIDDALVVARQLPGSSEDLRVLSACLAAADDHPAAIEVARQRVALAAPGQLGHAWYALAGRYFQADEPEHALPAVDTALSFLRNGGAASHPIALAASLRASILGSLGRGAEALPAALEAVRTLRELAVEEPDAHQLAYANAILVLLDCLRGMDAEDDKVPEADRAETVDVISRSLVWAIYRLTLDAAWRGDTNQLRSLTQLLIPALRDWGDIAEVANMLVTLGLDLLRAERMTESDIVLAAAEEAAGLLTAHGTSGETADADARLARQRALVARSRWQQGSDPEAAVETARQAVRVAASGGGEIERAMASHSLAIRLYRAGQVAEAFRAELDSVRTKMEVYDSERTDQVYMMSAMTSQLFTYAEEAGELNSLDDGILRFAEKLVVGFPGHRAVGEVLDHLAEVGFTVVMLYGRRGDPERAAAAFQGLVGLGERYPEHGTMRRARVMSAWNVVRAAVLAGRPGLAEPTRADVSALAAAAPGDETVRAERDACVEALS